MRKGLLEDSSGFFLIKRRTVYIVFEGTDVKLEAISAIRAPRIKLALVQYDLCLRLGHELINGGLTFLGILKETQRLHGFLSFNLNGTSECNVDAITGD